MDRILDNLYITMHYYKIFIFGKYKHKVNLTSNYDGIKNDFPRIETVFIKQSHIILVERIMFPQLKEVGRGEIWIHIRIGRAKKPLHCGYVVVMLKRFKYKKTLTFI